MSAHESPIRLLQRWFALGAPAHGAEPRRRWRFTLDRPLDAVRLAAAVDGLCDELDVARCALVLDGGSGGETGGATARVHVDARRDGGASATDAAAHAPLRAVTRGTALVIESSALWLDRRSALALLAELARRYADPGSVRSTGASSNGSSASVPALLDEERRRERSGATSRALAWWAERLPGRVADVTLPSTVGVAGSGRWRVHRALPDTGTDVDPGVRWLSALAVTLYRYGNRGPLLVDVPTRIDAAGDALGPFDHPLAVVLDPRGEETFAAFERRVATALAAARARGTVCAEQWLALRPDLRAASGRAAVPLRFSVAEAVPPVTRFGAVEATSLDEAPDPARDGYALSLAVRVAPAGADAGAGHGVPAGATSRLVLDVDGERCGVADAERVIEHFVRVAALGGSDDADVLALDDVVLTTPEEWRRELAWNDNAIPCPSVSPHRAFEAHASASPSRVAVVQGERVLRYGETNARANRLAHGLLERGLNPGDIVPLLLPRSGELVIAALACAKAGLVFAPLDTAWPSARLAGVLDRLDARVVVVEAGRAAPPGPAVGTVSSLASAAPEAHLDLRVGTSMDAPMYVIHTSGSTGEPKGAINTVGALVNRHAALERLLGPARAMAGLLSAAPFFDPSVTQVFWPLASGGRVVVVDETTLLDPRAMLELMRRSRFTYTDLVPSFLDLLVEEMVREPVLRDALTHRPALLIGGEAMLERPVRRLLEWFPDYPVYNDYGPSETAISVLVHRVRRTGDGPVPIGRPLPNVVALILDEAARPVPPGQTGELYVGGACVGLGYVGDAVRTARAFVPNPFPEIDAERLYRTGDRARRRHDGEIVFMGRADRQVKVRGVRIELEEVERALREEAGSTDVHVRAVGEGAARRLVGYVRTSDGETSSRPSTAAIERALRARLPGAACPSRLLTVRHWPRRRNGKLDEAALPLPGTLGKESACTGEDRGDERFVPLLAAWLGERPLAARRSLFEQGLDIATLVALAARLERLPGSPPTLAEIVAEPTLETLSRRVG